MPYETSSNSLSRRSLLGMGAGIGTGALLGGLSGCAGERPWNGRLRVLAWDFQPDTIRQLVADWSAAGNLPTDVAVLPSLGYGPALQTRLRGGDVPNVFYNYSYNSQKFVQEDWALGLADRPGIDDLLDALYPSARSRHVTADGKVVSVPYYSALHALIYNAQKVRQAGFTGPPTSLSETFDQCQALKNGGQAAPYVSYWVKEYCEEFLMRYLLNEEVTPFDEHGAPVFADDRRSTEVLAWWLAMYRDGMTPKSILNDDPGKSAAMMAQGSASFFALHHYFLSSVRSLTGPEVENIELAIGAPQTLQIGEVLQLGSVENPEAQRGSWDLMRYYSWTDSEGRYRVPAQWAKAAGLVAPYPGFFKDPDVRAALPEYYDLTLLDRALESASEVVPTRCAPWYPGFQAKAGDLIHGMLLGDNDPAETVAALADAAVDTKKSGGL